MQTEYEDRKYGLKYKYNDTQRYNDWHWEDKILSLLRLWTQPSAEDLAWDAEIAAMIDRLSW